MSEVVFGEKSLLNGCKLPPSMFKRRLVCPLQAWKIIFKYACVMNLIRFSTVFSECQKIQLTQQVWQVQYWVFRSRCPFFSPVPYFFPSSEALKENIQLNSPGNLFAIRFVLLASFLPPSVCSWCWSQLLLQCKKKNNNLQNKDLVLYLCVCVYVRVHVCASTICENSHLGASFLLGTPR